MTWKFEAICVSLWWTNSVLWKSSVGILGFYDVCTKSSHPHHLQTNIYHPTMREVPVCTIKNNATRSQWKKQWVWVKNNVHKPLHQNSSRLDNRRHYSRGAQILPISRLKLNLGGGSWDKMLILRYFKLNMGMYSIRVQNKHYHKSWASHLCQIFTEHLSGFIKL